MALASELKRMLERRDFLKGAGLTGLGLTLGFRSRQALAQPNAGGTLLLASFADVETWDPHKATSSTGLTASSPLYSQLVEFDPVSPGKIIADLAESWQVSGDGLGYTFRIRDNARWWDGKLVTADDVIFSLDRIKQVGKPRATAWLVYTEGWESVNPTTVRIRLKAPAAPFLAFFAVDYVKILPKHVVGSGVDIERPENIVGSGPFKFVRWTRGDSYEMGRNTNYFKPRLPYLDSLKFFVIRDKGTLIGAYKTERVLMQSSTFGGLSVQDYVSLGEDLKGRFTVHRLPVATSNVGIFLNVKRKPLDDPGVRKAMHLATDRQGFIKLLSHESVAAPGSPFPPDTWYSHTSREVGAIPGYRQPKDADIAEARRLLAAAGLAGGFKTSILVRRASMYPDIAALWKQQMARVGIDVEIRAVESAAGLAAYGEANFDTSTISSGILMDEPEAVIADAFRVGAVRNYAGWTNPDVERLVQLQRVERNEEKRAKILRELEDELLSWKNNHWIGLYWETDQWIVHNRVKDFVAPRSGNTTLKCEHYWLAAN